MGGKNSTHRVSFESDENDNITVVKGIRLSENVINRMRETSTPPPPRKREDVPPPPPPLLRPVPPLFDPITSLPPPPPVVEPVAPPSPPPPTEQVAAPTIIEMVCPSPSPMAADKAVQTPASEAAVAPALPNNVAANEPVTLPSTLLPPSSSPPVVPAPCPAAPESPVEPVCSPPVAEPAVVSESSSAPPPPPAPAVDEEALRKKITDELYKGFEQDRAKAEQELQAWLEEEKARTRSKVQAETQSQVQDEISRILSAQRGLAQESLQQAIIRERLATEDEKRRAELFAKQLSAREADLQKQDAFYREQVARLEERSAQFYKVTTENYHKAADQVNAKYKRYEIHPVCADLQGRILTCYKENAGKTLNCSNIAALYLQCVNNAKQNKLRTGG
ncbi:coiled-coil-helix-coiled-coil-helix domain containing 3a isoform X1 [Takifugu flavidus]|uniref:coiled-coil-helix-coiled-coil-helix domain containing 3a isoform X1 n=2 Tax=Takifugu flavidus TaxID=433684 RepID=UPI00254405DD|nr:coiled-coil-helix-coiled-coil-helix domain containing 3a isoform X1 [Takifugu flavidus]